MTDRIHVEDITQNHTPFGLLDDDTQARFRAWPHGARALSAAGSWMYVSDPLWSPVLTYRAIPAPLEKPTVDWSHVGPGINHFAADKSGKVYGYENRPRPSLEANLWVPGTGLMVPRTDCLFASYRRGTVPWNQSLISRPGVVE